jgi:hypothetical protein
MVCPTPLLESIPRPPAHLEHRPNPTPRTRRPLPAYPQFREGQQRRTLLCPTTTGPVEIRRSEPARQIATEEASDQDIPRILVGLHQAWLHLELLGQTGLSLLSDCFWSGRLSAVTERGAGGIRARLPFRRPRRETGKAALFPMPPGSVNTHPISPLQCVAHKDAPQRDVEI